MESIRVNFNESSTNVNDTTVLKAKIPRHGDLVAHMYLTFEIPDIESDATYRFRWVQNIGEQIIDNYYITIGGQKIEHQYGEFLHLLNEVALNPQKKELYDKMGANTTQFYHPEKFIFDNALIDHHNPPLKYRIANEYPAVTNFTSSNIEDYVPSIPFRQIYVPLLFWFSKDIGNALPLISLQYSEVELVIELKPWVELYRIFRTLGSTLAHHAPDLTDPTQRFDAFVGTLRGTWLTSPSTMDAKTYLEINYIFLDDIERKQFALKSLDYLIEQTRFEVFNDIGINNVFNLQFHNPVKELFFVLKRDDLANTNEWFNFLDENRHILKEAKLIFNGIDRIEEKPPFYFNFVQPWQHHSGNPSDGVYVYSFSLYPDDYQPSGSCNFSKIENFQLSVTTNPKRSYATHGYDIHIYAISYNFLRISSGLSGLVFAL